MSLETIPNPRTLRIAPWWIKHWTNADRARLNDEDELVTTAVPKCVGMKSGTGFFAMPPKGFPADRVRIRYQVFFGEDFDWNKGGKVGFGIGIGDGDETASGGDWMDNAGSIRCMWREDGQAIGYVYLPLEKRTRDAVIRSQSFQFEKAAEGSLGKDTGVNMFHKALVGLKFRRNKWNTVEWEVALNDLDKRNGILRLTINDETRMLDNVVYRRTNAAIKFNGILFESFFGGSTLDWACKSPQTFKFRNVQIQAS